MEFLVAAGRYVAGLLGAEQAEAVAQAPADGVGYVLFPLPFGPTMRDARVKANSVFLAKGLKPGATARLMSMALGDRFQRSSQVLPQGWGKAF